MITFEIPGEPIAKCRPRFNRKTNIAFDPQMLIKNNVKFLIKEAWNRLKQIEPYQGSLKVDIEFYCPFRPSTSKSQNLISWNSIAHTKKPDIDNVIKFYFDCMNGIVYNDDRQITNINVKKVYAPIPKTVISIMPEESLEPEIENILSEISHPDFLTIVELLDKTIFKMGELERQKQQSVKIRKEAAYFISLFADRFGKKLAAISKKYPEAWKKFNQ